MTTPHNPEAHLLVILGEVRGDVKGVLRSQAEFSTRLTDLEARLGGRIKSVEIGAETRMDKIEGRISSLESLRLKVAGFVLAISLLATALQDKIIKFFHGIIGG